jgi:cytochrome bd ubiquinol oxidase subunit I
MQHPVGYEIDATGRIALRSLAALLLNPWTFWQYLHNMIGAVVTGAFAMASLGAYYLLAGRHLEFGKTSLRLGVVTGLIGALLLPFPTGDGQAKNVIASQPATLAAMEGLFQTTTGAPMSIIGQPDMERRRLDNAITVPGLLSLLSYGRWDAEVQGLDAFPRDQVPDSVPLLFYSYHVMIGLGVVFIGVMGIASWMLWRRRLFNCRPLLWLILVMFPFPYIANTAGWMTAELGRQPWVIYGLMRTSEGFSTNVSSGNAMFTLIGFVGVYVVLSILFVLLVGREIAHGPAPEEMQSTESER